MALICRFFSFHQIFSRYSFEYSNNNIFVFNRLHLLEARNIVIGLCVEAVLDLSD